MEKTYLKLCFAIWSSAAALSFDATRHLLPHLFHTNAVTTPTSPRLHVSWGIISFFLNLLLYKRTSRLLQGVFAGAPRSDGDDRAYKTLIWMGAAGTVLCPLWVLAHVVLALWPNTTIVFG